MHFSFKNLELEKIFEGIGKNRWKEQINLAHTKRGGYDENKKNLPCFTPSGTFRIRCDWDLIEYSQIVHLDYDDLDNPARIRQLTTKCDYTYASFVSPSGKGVKVFVKVNSNADLHQEAFRQVRAMYDDDLVGIKSDTSVSNISRLCFVSGDESIYVDPNSKVFEVSRPKESVTVPDMSILADAKSVFGYLYNLTVKGKYQGEFLGEYGSKRNNFLYVFACNCNLYGIDKNTCNEFMKSIWVQNNLGFSANELNSTVISAYKHVQEFSKFRLPKNLTSEFRI